jgi:hypothetical protein
MLLPLQLAETSLIDVTCSVAPAPALLIVEDGVPAGLAVDDGGLVLGGVVDGLVDDGDAADEPAPPAFSSVPFTSTLWLRYFDQLSLELPLAIKSSVVGILAIPEVPAVPAAPDLSVEL